MLGSGTDGINDFVLALRREARIRTREDTLSRLKKLLSTEAILGSLTGSPPCSLELYWQILDISVLELYPD